MSISGRIHGEEAPNQVAKKHELSLCSRRRSGGVSGRGGVGAGQTAESNRLHMVSMRAASLDLVTTRSSALSLKSVERSR